MFSYLPRNKIKWFTILIFPFYVYLSDLIIRYNYLKVLDAKGITNFSISLLFELLLAFSILYLVSLFGKKRMIAIGFLTFLFTTIQILVYGHYYYFGVLPNNYSINYLFRNPSDSLALITGSIDWFNILVFPFLCLLNFVIINYSSQGFDSVKKKFTYLILSLFIISLFIFNNNVRFHPSSYSVSPATLFSVKYVIQQRFGGGDFQIEEGYVQRKYEIKESHFTKPLYNVLIFLSESVTSENLQYYGYDKTNSPFVTGMIKDEKIILFNNHYANSVSTQFSMPMIFSGQFELERLNQPFIYDYLKKWTDINTFFISSQSYQTDNFDLIINTSFDYFICQENSGEERFNDRGIDDNLLINFLEKFLDGNSEKNFLGIIQFNNTHYPYKISKDQFKIFKPAAPGSLNSYNNSIYEQDHIMKKYFDMLDEKGLLESTIIFFISDHGEAFAEHGHSGHLQTLYNEDIATPLWIYLPASFDSLSRNSMKKNINKPTSNLDLFPTILDLYDGLDQSKLNLQPQGSSLISTINTERFIPVAGMDMLDTKAVINNKYKFILTNKNGTETIELFDTLLDRVEENNLWGKADKITRQKFLDEIKKLEHIKFKGF